VEYIDGYMNRSIGVPRYFFRGQSNAELGLLPSLARYCKNRDIQWALKHELKMLQMFREEAHNHLSTSLLPLDQESVEVWWPIMQHYGAPTRLLDWSNSPFIAAYFAVSKITEDDGAVFLVHPHKINLKAKEEHGYNEINFLELCLKPEDSKFLLFFQPSVKQSRVSAQQGGFSVCGNPLKDHIIAIGENVVDNNDPDRLQKIIIPAHLKSIFLLRLHQMNITARTLYQGIDGLGQSLAEYLVYESKHTDNLTRGVEPE
jgi:hypothetical protein